MKNKFKFIVGFGKPALTYISLFIIVSALFIGGSCADCIGGEFKECVIALFKY